MAVREPRPDDADAMGRLHVAAWRSAYRGGLMPDAYLDALDPEERAAYWAEALGRPRRPGFVRLVAEDEDGTVVAFVVGGPAEGDPEADAGEVYALNVAPAAWGRGHGRRLLGAAQEALARAGFDHAHLWVHPDNARARRFYEHHGWQATADLRTEEVHGVTVTEVRYEQSLDR